MTKPDPSTTLDHIDDARDYSTFKRIALGALGGFAFLFLPAFAVGFTKGRLGQGPLENTDFAILGAAALLLIVICFAVWRMWPAESGEPEAPRVKQSRMVIFTCMGVGALLGMILVLTQEPGVEMFFDGPINPIIAGVVIAVWLLFVPIATLKWLRTVDEHEADAYREGAFIAGHAYLFLAPAWWMAHRAGWLPAQDPMIVFLIICTVWSAVWFAKRYL
jgi:hypothetical protein